MELAINRGTLPMSITIDWQIKNPVHHIGHLSLNCWPGEFLKLPQNMQGFAITIVDSPELDSRTLLMKILHTWVVEHGETKPGLTWKLHPYWLDVIVLEGSVHATRVKELINSLTQWLLCRTTAIATLVRYPYCCNRGTSLIGVINHFLLWFEACFTRWNSCLILSTGPKTHGWLHHKGGPKVVVYLLTY